MTATTIDSSAQDVAEFKTAFAKDPRAVTQFGAEVSDSIAPAELDDVRLDHARRRFEQARESIPFVRQLAESNGIARIDEAADLVPLFFTHETFKSYPQAWLENGDFTRLTRWLGKLCAADVSSVEAGDCTLIEEWMAALIASSEIDVQISTSADGKAAFMPRSKDEWALLNAMNLKNLQAARDAQGEVVGLEPGKDRVPLIYLGARRGARSMSRFLDLYEDTYGPGLVDTMFEYSDADLLSLAGRIREASRKGDAVQINPDLLARKDEIARINADQPARMEALKQRLLNDYRGQRIIVYGTMQLVYDLAMRFREMGVTAAYAPESLFLCGSGFANGVEPPNWKQEVEEILGLPPSAIRVGYSMQEALWSMPGCEYGKFHVPVSIIPYVLDENDSPLPRTGSQTGRFAFFDLLPQTCWGGFATGDKVTITWDESCACGRASAYLDSPITRISTTQEDKITCAGTAGALEEATDFLLRS